MLVCDRLNFVWSPTRLTVAPEMMAPEVSVTVPVMPPNSWARALVAARNTNSENTAKVNADRFICELINLTPDKRRFKSLERSNYGLRFKE